MVDLLVYTNHRMGDMYYNISNFNFFQSILRLPCNLLAVLTLSLTNNRDPVFQLNEEPLTDHSGPVNLASKMAPKEKTPEKGEMKAREKGGSKKEKEKNSR